MPTTRGKPRVMRKSSVDQYDQGERNPKRKSTDTTKHSESKKVKLEESPQRTKKPGRSRGSKSKAVEAKTGGMRKTKLTKSKLKTEIKNEKVRVKKENVKTSSRKKVVKRGGHGCQKLVGAHLSIKGGLDNAVYEAVDIGASSFAMFLKSQRQWSAKPMDEKVAERFRDACKEFGFTPDMIIPHGSYLLNCGSPNAETLKKSRDALVDELKRCEKLGITLYNFHPGSTCGDCTVEKCINNIATSINMAHSKTKYVTTVIENMCCQGNTIGGRFEELRGIIDKVKDKSRIGVCLDTCHAFAAGFDLTSDAGYNKFISDFKRIIGFKYLKAVHLNDSKGVCGCHLDRHENIGKGHIGLDGFRRVMSDPHFENIPMILETPAGMGYDKEIKILHKLCGD